MEADDFMGNLWAGGLLTVNIFIFQAFIPFNALDKAELISVSAIALAMPILGGYIVINFTRGGTADKIGGFETFVYFFGHAAAIVGIDAAMWHLSWIAAVLFLVATCNMFVLFVLIDSRLSKKQR